MPVGRSTLNFRRVPHCWLPPVPIDSGRRPTSALLRPWASRSLW